MDLPIKVFWSITGFSLGCEEKACSGIWVSGGFVGVGAEGGCSRHLFVLSLHVWACFYTCTHISSCPSDYTAISDLHGLKEARRAAQVNSALSPWQFCCIYMSKCWATLCWPCWLYLSPWTHEGWCRFELTDCFTWPADQLIMWLSDRRYKSV